ncbi:hypothetical protein RND71_014632 [Anisodus tanguticus]|uniref:Uncharacterized protein n=1 Tax=Anisodus tanguticus TaxID=243964 RepID=A0AAE1SC39_9SOLA|nr:hypothetical protein RND71_014632 [Anisodus tanguticus]
MTQRRRSSEATMVTPASEIQQRLGTFGSFLPHHFQLILEELKGIEGGESVPHPVAKRIELRKEDIHGPRQLQFSEIGTSTHSSPASIGLKEDPVTDNRIKSEDETEELNLEDEVKSVEEKPPHLNWSSKVLWINNGARKKSGHWAIVNCLLFRDANGQHFVGLYDDRSIINGLIPDTMVGPLNNECCMVNLAMITFCEIWFTPHWSIASVKNYQLVDRGSWS